MMNWFAAVTLLTVHNFFFCPHINEWELWNLECWLIFRLLIFAIIFKMKKKTIYGKNGCFKVPQQCLLTVFFLLSKFTYLFNGLGVEYLKKNIFGPLTDNLKWTTTRVFISFTFKCINIPCFSDGTWKTKMLQHFILCVEWPHQHIVWLSKLCINLSLSLGSFYGSAYLDWNQYFVSYGILKYQPWKIRVYNAKTTHTTTHHHFVEQNTCSLI